MRKIKLSNGALSVPEHDAPRSEIPVQNQPYIYVMPRPRSQYVECGLDLFAVERAQFSDEDLTRWVNVSQKYNGRSIDHGWGAVEIAMWGDFPRKVQQFIEQTLLEIAVNVIRENGVTEIYYENSWRGKILTLLPN